MKPLLKSALAKFGYRIQATRYIPRQLLDPTYLRAVEFDDIVCRRMFAVGPELNFIQIGVFDGVTNDPLRKYIDKSGWRGVLVEPQPGAVRRLRELYRDNERIVVLQAALDGKPGKRTLFTVEPDRAPAWAGGLASFERATIMKHAGLIEDLQSKIREETVDCIVFETVLDNLQQTRIDLLQIDTEGFDAFILSLFPFERVRPAIVHWEVKHLSKAAREDALNRLGGFGYRFAPSGGEDMMAVQF